jgi:hypothetical protein
MTAFGTGSILALIAVLLLSRVPEPA